MIIGIKIQLMKERHTAEQLNNAGRELWQAFPHANIKFEGWHGGDIGKSRCEINSDDPYGGMDEVREAEEKIRRIMVKYPADFTRFKRD
jgi:hypothetical protein